MLYIVGLGLNFDGISDYGKKIVKRCKKVYLETYTVNFPYSKTKLSESLGKRFLPINREKVENFEFLDEAVKTDIALLVYGSPLTATTHIALLDEAKKSGIKTKVIYSASIIDAVAETGLQLYKFGKTTSMPAWNREKKYTPDSFMNVVKENKSINAHTLILIDIGLRISDAVNQLKDSTKKHKINLKKIIVCQCLGTKQSRIYYDKIDKIKDYNIRLPYCIVIPGKLHFIEREYLENFK